MKKVLLGIFIGVVIAGIAFALLSNKTLKVEDGKIEVEEKPKYEIKPIAVSELTQSAWIPEWGMSLGIESLTINKDKFHEISPVLYGVNEDGSLKILTKKGIDELKVLREEKNIIITPSIALFDDEILSSVLQNDENKQRHIDEIVKNVLENDFDGIDLDYESTKLIDKDDFFDLLNKLKAELKKENKKLIFTALPKWGDQIIYPSFPQTRQVQDYAQLAEIVDELRIMCYDYTFQGSIYPGAIAPIKWIEDIVKYATQKADPKKIVLAARNYSYDWPYDGSEIITVRPLDQLKSASSPVAKGYTYEDVVAIKNKYEGEDTFDSEIGEGIYKFTNNKDEERIMFYSDSRSIKAHKELAAKYGLKGVAYWRLGSDKGIQY